MSQTDQAEKMTDLTGEHYTETLGRFHTALRPKTYFEIGVLSGMSLAKARCSSIGVDPSLQIAPEFMRDVLSKPSLHLFATESDKFFTQYNPTKLLDQPIDFAFLDGMHNCEFLLRDFINTERYCKPNSVIALHDCLPVDLGIVDRDPCKITQKALPHRQGWWAGDVWRTSRLLRMIRPDLRMMTLDSAPTGLVLFTNLNPESDLLIRSYASYVQEMLSWNLAEIGLRRLFEEMSVMPAAVCAMPGHIESRFPS